VPHVCARLYNQAARYATLGVESRVIINSAMNMFKPSRAKTPQEYIDMIEDPQRKEEIKKLDQFIQKTTPSLERHFATNMLGYGSFHYKTRSGREGDWPVLALANQKNYISLYVCAVKDGKYIAETNADKLGKVKVGKSCVNIKKLSDINMKELERVLLEAQAAPGLV
jgi:hypothetical protein